MKKIDLTGQRFGRLVVIREAGRKNGHVAWLCRCDCGNEVVINGAYLRNGKSQSCGCLVVDLVTERNTLHGYWKSHKRLMVSIRNHIQFIRDPTLHNHKYYKHLRVSAKYLGVEGLTRFVKELVKRFPKECELYERDKSLQVDKDYSKEPVFAPWTVTFMSAKENINQRDCSVRLDDGTALAMLCSSIGIETREVGSIAPKYSRIQKMWRNSHKPHPELMQALKDDTDRQSRLLEITKLKVRHAELMIKGLKKLTTSKSDTLDMRPS